MLGRIPRQRNTKKVIYKDFYKFKKTRLKLRKARSLLLTIKSTSQMSSLLRFSYTRYADDWIILF